MARSTIQTLVFAVVQLHHGGYEDGSLQVTDGGDCQHRDQDITVTNTEQHAPRAVIDTPLTSLLWKVAPVSFSGMPTSENGALGRSALSWAWYLHDRLGPCR